MRASSPGNAGRSTSRFEPAVRLALPHSVQPRWYAAPRRPWWRAGARGRDPHGNSGENVPVAQRRYTRPVSSTRHDSGAPVWAVGLAAGLAVLVLWRYRGVLPTDVLMELALPWLWLLLWTAAAWGAGRLGAVVLLGRGAGDPGPVVVLALGSALLALVGTVLASAGGFTPLWLLVVFSGATVAGLVGWFGRRTPWPVLQRLPSGALAAVGVASLAIAAGLAAPPVMYDTLHYHLAFPAQWLRAGGFVQFPREAFSYYPAAGGMAYGYGLALLGPWSAKALHLWAGLVAAAAAGTLGGRLGGRAAGAWSAVLFFLTPSVLQSAGFATADLWVAAWGGAAVVLLLDDEDKAGSFRRFGAVGFLAGSAAAAKLLGLATVLVPVAVVGLFMVAYRNRQGGVRWRPLAALAAGAAVPLAPWLVRNALWTGNPLYPYLRGLFGGPVSGLSIAGEVGQNALSVHGIARVGEVAVALVVRTFHPLQLAGNIGPLWIVLLPVAVALPRLRRHRDFLPLVLAAGTGLLAWGSLVQFGRFVLPVLVWCAALAGAAMAGLARGADLRVARTALVILVAGVLAWNATVLLGPMAVGKLEVTSGILPARRFLGRWASYWPAARFCATALPEDARVLMVAEARSLYVDRDVVVEDPYHVPLLAELAATAGNSGELAARLRAMGVTHLLVNEREMQRLAELRHVPDYWSGAGAHGRAVLRAFFEHGVHRLFQAPGLWVAELRPAGDADSPRRAAPESRPLPGPAHGPS